MQMGRTKRMINQLFVAGLLFFAAIGSASAELQKFVYVFNDQGILLAPNNAASQCPDPDNITIINNCHGVRVTSNGTYSIELAPGIITSPENVVVIAKTYEFIAANSMPNIDRDTYIEIQNKRRLEKITPQEENSGVDINVLSEISVKATEEYYGTQLGTQNSDTTLKELAPDFDANTLNATFNNSTTDNTPTTNEDTAKLGLIKTNQNDLDATTQDALEDLAVLALENQEDTNILNAIEKNLTQALVNPELIPETTDRIVSQVANIINGEGIAPIMMLDADRYVAKVNEVVNLTTENSINPEQFFGYTWIGVESDNTHTTFSRGEPGTYLICVTGESTNANDSSSDCVRIEVKPISYAVITAYPLQVPTNDKVDLSGLFSVGATSYTWSAYAGSFTDRLARDTTWIAPNVKGTYTITLAINGDKTDTVDIEVYDILPVAIATSSTDLIYIDEPHPSATLTSSSIASNGSAIDSIEWTVIEKPDNSNPTLSSANGVTSNFTSDTLGTYVIRHTAVKNGISDFADLTIELREHGVPIVNAGPDFDSFRGVTSKLNGSKSYEPDGLALTYNWTTDSGSVANDTQAVAKFTPTTIGEVIATLTASNGIRSASDTATITIRNRLPLASDDFFGLTLNETASAPLHAFDSDGDPLTYALFSYPDNGGVTIEDGHFIYIAGGEKGCAYNPDHKPYPNWAGGLYVPVIKLCADKYTVVPGDTITLTTSDSINASKFAAYSWLGVESDTNTATYAAGIDDIGLQKICAIGNIAQSNNTSTACVEIEVKDALEAGDNPALITEGYSDSIQFIVNDGHGNSTPATIAFQVDWVNTPPTVDNKTFTTDEDTDVSGTLTSRDIDGQLAIFSVQQNGSKGVLTITNSTTGTFTYSPNLNAFGTDTVKVKSFDGHDYSTPATITININGLNDKPVANNSIYTTLEDVSIIGGQLNATEPDGDPLTYTLLSNGTIGTVTLDTTTGRFNYTPNPNGHGHDSFFFRVNDGHDDSNIASASITVQAVNDPPIAHDLERIFTAEGKPFGATLNGEDIDLDLITYRLLSSTVTSSKGELGTAVITNANTGAFSFTPNPGANGSGTISFVVNDGTEDSNVGFVPVTVSPNNPPVAADLSLSVEKTASIIDSMRATDAENHDLTYKIQSGPTKGTLQILNLSTGEFKYTPNNTAIGTDSFTYTASDYIFSSNVATVNITITSFNNPPVANTKVFEAFEGIPYSHYLSGSDVENTPLTFTIDTNGSLGSANLDDVNSGQFTYTGFPGNTGTDLFTIIVDDGDKKSSPGNVTANIISTAVACAGPDATNKPNDTKRIDYDSDNDGYADMIEVALGSNPNDKAITPDGINVANIDASFRDEDDDTDGFSDIVEIWLHANHTDTNSVPTDSLLKGVPSCVSGGIDKFAPAMLAFDIVTPVVTISGTDNIATFSITAIDNQSGVKLVKILLRSPSGEELEAVFTQDSASMMLYRELSSSAFSLYAEPGIWKVIELTLADENGNVRVLGTADLVENEFPTNIEVINPFVDTAAPTLLNFTILTPILDLADAPLPASFNIEASDNLSGIRKISVTAQSPSGKQFRWGEVVDDTKPKSINVQIDSNGFDAYTEIGIWKVSELALIDEAGHALRLNTTQIAAAGFNTDIEVINGLLDTTPPTLDNFKILTPDIYPQRKDAIAKYEAVASDSDSGVQSIESLLTSSNGKETKVTIVGSPDNQTPFTAALETDIFSTITEPGTWSITYVKVTDGAGNSAEFNTAYLAAQGFDSKVNVIYFGSGKNNPPVAYGNHLNIDEDTPYAGHLSATDADGHAVTYHIDATPQYGTVSINSTSGAFTYTPNKDYNGADEFSFYADDGYQESNIATISIIVNPINDPPISRDFEIIVTANTIHYGILPKSDPDGDSLTFSIVDNGSLGTASILNANNGRYKYIPLADALGTDSFSYTVSDGTTVSGPYTATVTITPDIWVVDFNVLTPVITNKNFTTTIQASVSFNRPATDFVYASIDLIGPSGQIISFAVDPSKAGVDPIQFNTSFFTDSIDLEAGSWVFRNLAAKKKRKTTAIIEDDLNNAGFNATVRVNTNELPNAPDHNITTQQNRYYICSLSGSDPDGDPITYRLLSDTDLGIATIDPDTGAFEFTPHSYVTGSTTVTYVVNDGYGDSNIGTISIEITEKDKPLAPIAYTQRITVFKNLAYGGQLQAWEPDGKALAYHVETNPSKGTVALDETSGEFIYTPNQDTSLASGSDYFSFYTSNGTVSNIAYVLISIKSEAQVCDRSDNLPGIDQDKDGYADVVEQAFGTDINDATSTPKGMSEADLGISFIDDDDNDGFLDYIEIWMGSDPYNSDSKPTDSSLGLLPDCFNSSSDGIKPRLLAFNINTQTIDISSGNGSAGYTMTLIDNASGTRRARIDLMSPSGAFVTTSTSFDSFPVVKALELNSSTFSQFGEQGVWQIAGITLYDEAGNKRGLNLTELTDAGFPTDINIINLASDSTAPILTNFSLVSDNVNAVGGNTTVGFNVSATDDIAGITSIVINLTSPSGVVLEAVSTHADTIPTSLTSTIISAPLSEFAEQGSWTVSSLVITDAAGNSVQYADNLNDMGFPTSVAVTNTGGDSIAPWLTNFSILTPEVFPAGGYAQMSFIVSGRDDISGIEKIRVGLEGPKGQYLAAWGFFFNDSPLLASTQINTATLSTALQEGDWIVKEVEIFDAAGHSTRISTHELFLSGYSYVVRVGY